MKKKIIAIFVIALMVTVIPLVVKAHPGRTDGRGGHANHSTGEYHYHHGYSAHDHYDMDGDGDIDCPYDFKDKTDRSSYSSNRADSTIETTEPDTVDDHSGNRQISLVDIMVAILEQLPIAIGAWLSSSYFLFYIFCLIFGKEQGCSIAMIVGAVISIFVSIWLIISRLS